MNTECVNKNVSRALAVVDAAEQRCQKLIATVYPVGRELRWERSGGVQIGNVVAHSGYRAGEHIRVRNMHTQKSYWIWVGDIRE